LYSIVTKVKGVLSAGDCVTYTILFAVTNVEFLEMSPDVVGFSLRGHVPAQVEFVGVTRLSFDAWNLSVKWLSGDYLYQSVWRYRMATESVITPWPFFSSWCRVLTKFLILLHCIREWLRVLCLQIHTIRSCESWWCQNFQHFLSWACFLILEVVYVGD